LTIIDSEDSGNPGLLPSVQVTEVVVAALTGHTTPSIIISYYSISSTKFYPENVTSAPPTTEPNLGLIDSSNGVI
jgi:hypothetical protein